MTPQEFSKQELINKLANVLKETEAKLEAQGYVVAGYSTGGTYYAYVGKGRGLDGAELIPSSIHPIIFGSEEEANKKCLDGYFNGADEQIFLNVVTASTYFQTIYKDYSDKFESIKEILSK